MVLFTAGCSQPLTLEAIGQFGPLGLKPIIFVLNTSGSAFESPHTRGCDEWLTLRVRTYAQLDKALAQASRATRAVYIEIVSQPTQLAHAASY